MFIQTEETPNPATVKFLPGQVVLETGTAEFETLEDASVSPLAQALFGLQGVESVFFGHDFVSISKAVDTDWSMLKPMILGALMQHFSTGQPVMVEGARVDGNAPSEDDDEITLQIKELITERVRPSVMMDGGDIEFERFDEGIVYLRLKGACSGCPSSKMTLKSGIENMLKHYVPEVIEVQAVNG